ncbi:MAG: DnaD domain protein [Erysipelotrichaceae bacterium]|nr:DnaD domain protein [Erysipelotrichaceae bacterium]
MEYRGRNSYRVIQNQQLNSETLASLAVFYEPLIGADAFALYHLLASEAGKSDEGMNLQRLCQQLNCNIDELTRCIRTLEQFRLLRSFYNEGQESCRFDLQVPLSPAKFMAHEIFGRLYAKKVGHKHDEVTSRMYRSNDLRDESDEEVTSEFDFSFFNRQWDMEDEYAYDRQKQIDYSHVKSDFDLEKLLRITSEAIMPQSLRTRENLEIIAGMGTVFSIDPDTMRFLLGDAIDYDDNDKLVFSPEKLRKLCLDSKRTTSVQGEGYDMSPVQYLMNLQNGLQVTSADKKILEYLQVDLRLPREVINLLVEYVYTHNDRSLNRNYLEKIATVWAGRGVDSLDKSREQLQQRPAASRNRVRDFVNVSKQPSESQNYEDIMAQLFEKGD